MSKHDVIIIGGGPAGYVAAIRCAQLGLDTLVIDDQKAPTGKPSLGGTCLNVGCIPSKALLDASEKFHQAQHSFADMGIKTSGLTLDLNTMMAHKTKVVSNLTQGVHTLFKAHKIHFIHGRGMLLQQLQVKLKPEGQDPEIRDAKHIILATGSHSVDISAAPTDGTHIVDSSGALSFDAVPKRLIVIGAGVIGLELGSVWARLGSKVTLLEAQNNFLPMMDQQISRTALKHFKDNGLDIRLGARVLSTKITGKQVTVEYQDTQANHKLKGDKVLVAVGRGPNTHHLAAAETELLIDESGFVHVDQYCATNLPNVWAIGDLVRGPMLAHKGSEEGIMVAERIVGKAGQVNYNVIPSVVYTEPEIAWTGKTEQQLKADQMPYKKGVFPFAANGRAHAQNTTKGFIKVLSHPDTDQILGIHMIGANASELIAEAVLAMEYQASAEDLARTIHAHPTLSEALHEAALAVNKAAIHKFS